jgi:addiction module RelE/StbE family toxin
MWQILEHREVGRVCRKLPPAILEKYQAWKNLVQENGPEKLKEYPGYRDEKLEGERFGQRSSRLSRQYRVIYQVHKTEVTVRVLEITPHKY